MNKIYEQLIDFSYDIINLVINMKYIIASDIHGNLEYMEKLDKFISFEQDDLDGLILLGDLLNNWNNASISQ